GNWIIIEVHGESNVCGFYKYKKTIDPMNPDVGKAIVDKFLKRFEERNPGESGKALNYFFQDEEKIRGEEVFPWNSSFADEFKSRKGYDIIPFLPALFEDTGDITPKIRLDYHDVKAERIGNGYFKPIFDWSWSHGMIFGSDNNGRGLDPVRYGDYFRAHRYMTAPGNDIPGRNSDLMKVKVNSSIAHLYQRPRVWLEAYHSSGWGTTLESITVPTSENYVFGSNLLNFQGLYYSTHGGWFEWAPPDLHFRMPYWDHEGVWLTYYERLSYLMSQGHHCCDAAILYPVSALEAGSDDPGASGMFRYMRNTARKAVDTAFDTGKRLAENGIDFDFIDFESVNNSQAIDGKLNISGEKYRVLILPAVSAIRMNTIQKVLEHYRAGGIIIAVGRLPCESDRVGRNDERLDLIIQEIFGRTAKDLDSHNFKDNKADSGVLKNINNNGGIGIYIPEGDHISNILTENMERDFIPLNDWGNERNSSELGKGYVNHRRIGNRDVYMVRNVPKYSECFFRSKGRVELWNPWEGTIKPIYTFKPAEGGTVVRMPMEIDQDNIIVFTPGECGSYIEATNMDTIETISADFGSGVVGYSPEEGEKFAAIVTGGRKAVLKGHANAVQKIPIEGMWDFELKPTLDNQWGDFRLPATQEFIAAEARFFSYRDELALEPGERWYTEDYDDSSWEKITYSKGPMFGQYVTPVGLFNLDDENKISIVNCNIAFTEYAYSIRWGITDSSVSEQNSMHGLNCIVPNEFLVILPEKDTYYWTTVHASAKTHGKILAGEVKPSAIWINERSVCADKEYVQLEEGINTVLLKYSNCNKERRRAYFVLEQSIPDGKNAKAKFVKYPLAMEWFGRPDIYRYDAYPRIKPNTGLYRFVSPLGLNSMRITAYGSVRVWMNGREVYAKYTGETSYGASEYDVAAESKSHQPVKVAIRIEQKRGYYQGAALPEPVKLDCTAGTIRLGDWSRMGVLETYSGGAWYRKKISIPKKEAKDKVIINLGKVAATAEVKVNGCTAGILVCPPWKLDISTLAKKGENDIEILVYNTLSNHYSTIPSRYSNFPGDAVSGLIGPVDVEIMPAVTLN
ncbi:MAG TPA: hypothetical protein DCY35_09490, partial [Prolixibacteraceae bacterium]|nr:hypothetical protein [Prolixibacteraceae bacterium]